MKLIAKSFLLGLLIAWSQAPANAQIKLFTKDASRILNFQFLYTHVTASGDFASRFNTFHGLGGGMLYKTKHNIILSAEGHYNFGNDIKPTNMLLNLTNSMGNVNNAAGFPGEISLSMRGFNVMGKLGYLFPVSSINKNTGFVVMFGGGIVMHRYNIAVSRNDIPSLTDEKKKGYDRYSSGWAFSQFIGYYHQSKNKLYNFFIGGDFIQGFTYNRRQYNYDTMEFDTNLKRDNYIGLRLGWMIPIYLNASGSDDEYIFR